MPGETSRSYDPTPDPADYRPITVAQAGALAQAAAKDQVLIVAWDRAHGRVQYTTWGRTADDKVQAANLADRVSQVLSAGQPRTTFEDFRSAGEAARNKAAADELLAELERILADHANERDRYWAPTRALVARLKGGQA